MRIPFFKSSRPRGLRLPLRSGTSALATMNVAALYRGARVGGDFYDFVNAGKWRLLFVLLDIAGQRAEALDIAASVQETFRGAADLFAVDDVNEPVALSQLLLEINRAIMAAAGGVRCAPGFLGCFNEAAGTVSYINAGHTPALLKDASEVSALESTGLPLGLFSHATHDARIFAMPPGATLLMISRGLLEVRSGGEEFGLDRVRERFANSTADDPQGVCAGVLEGVHQFLENPPRNHRFLPNRRHQVGEDGALSANDATAVALMRAAAAASASA